MYLTKINEPRATGEQATGEQATLLSLAMNRHLERSQKNATAQAEALRAKFEAVVEGFRGAQSPETLLEAWRTYLTDSVQRSVLTLDALRQRGDMVIAHEAAGTPPVLIYDYEMVIDGRELPRPSCYMLLRITPPEGVEVFEWKRPYVIIDPRAGHGGGIGGFKPDSQVGVALKDGHPVYFVAFRPMPEPEQTLADVTYAEATFLREITKRHPDAPHPIVVGNCQGWATAILAATNPDLAGPIVLNGAPMAYWSGQLGQDPMRYTGGIVGGLWPALFMSDLGGGLFDGAHLVINFETLNPGRNWFSKYYDLYADIDHGVERFLGFEKWWGCYFLMNGEEMRWIVENLFVGNRLARNKAQIENGRSIDLKAIRAPIIVFASHGDNITPPPQALNWIVDTYADEAEIELRGQRIIYMVHERVGHLGIFVSSSVAKREHSQVASTLKTIEALPPGLYEMKIEDIQGEGHAMTFTVDFAKRRMADILKHGHAQRTEEGALAAVARMSETLAEAYDVFARPLVRAMVTPDMAAQGRALHPLRTQRRMFASSTPGMSLVAQMAEKTRAKRQPADADNPFVMAERLWADCVVEGWNVIRDWREMAFETMFLSVYASPLALWYGRPWNLPRAKERTEELRALPEVSSALQRIEAGGLAEAVVRILVLLSDTRRDVRRDRLQIAVETLLEYPLYRDMTPAQCAHIIYEQTLISRLEPEAALMALPKLLVGEKNRKEAMKLVDSIVLDRSEMEPATVTRIDRIRRELGFDRLTQEAAE